MDRFVTVAVFTLPHELAVVRARLEWEGITCFAKDENTVSAHPFYSNVVGGIKLQVPVEDVERARAILIESGDVVPDGTDRPADTPDTKEAVPSFTWPTISPKGWRYIGLCVAGSILLALLLFV